ncbi:hypothetical protein P8452_64904 [Trifolium repens]|nr:hypothetical protein P8452_64904 [Trifolium repens]
MFPLTSSNWGSNVFNLMLLKTKYSLQFAVGGNEFQKPDSFYQFTPHSHGSSSYPTKITGNNKAIKASLDLKDGEYVLKLTTVDKDGTTAAEQAQTAAMLLSQAALLRQLGEKLLNQSEFFKSLDI